MEKKAFQVIFILLAVTLGLLWQVKFGGGEDKAIEAETDAPQQVRGKLLRQEAGQVAKSEPDSDALEITFLDVGQGDATFIEWPGEVQMLVDCGPDTKVLAGLGRVLPFYDRTIDYLVVTHPDLDHYGGCTDVLTRYDIGNIVYTGVQKVESSWQYFWEQIQGEGAKYHQIDKEQTWEIGRTTVRFLYPDHPVRTDLVVPGFAKSGKDNNTSIIMKLSLGESDVLLTADAEKELEEYLVNTFGDQLDVEVLKISHHGSGGSSITPFIAAVTPDHAIISVGAGNSYGHPSRRVLRRLERSSSTIWRTDAQGDVKVRVYQDHVEVR